MTPFKTALLSALGVLGIVPTTGAYFKDKEYIWDLVKEDVISQNISSEDSSLSNIWTELKTQLSSKTQIKDEELKTIRDKIEQQKEEDLKNWCFRSYEKTYRDWFQSKNNDLLDDVKSVCQITIKDKLGTTKVLNTSGNTDQSTFQERLQTLKGEKEETLEEFQDLLNLKKSGTASTSQEEWKKLQKWCGSIYERGYLGTNSPRWKLAEKFCSKTTLKGK